MLTSSIICLNDWKPVKALNVTDRLEFETVWCKISTPNSEYYVTGIYHLPDPAYDPVDLLEYISGTCDQILADDPAPVPGKPISANRGLNIANRRINFIPLLDSVPESTDWRLTVPSN